MNHSNHAWKRCIAMIVLASTCLFVALLTTAIQSAHSDPVPAMTTQTAVQYTVTGTPELMDIFTPPDTTKPLPVIVYIHGGGWVGGTRLGAEGYATHFTGKGYVFCSIDYRLSGVAKYPAQIEDCKCAIRFLRANAAKFHIDPKRIGVWGDSAGGNLVTLLGTTSNVKRLEGKGGWQDQSSRVQAVLDWYGPTDLTTDFRKDYTNPDGINYIHQYLGDPIDPKLAADASPLQFVTTGLPPFLIEHGDQDPLVPISQSKHFYDKLKAVGNDVTFQVVPGAGHGGGQFFTPENIALIDAFFARTLK